MSSKEFQQCKELLMAMMKEPANRRCADCGSYSATWCSTGFGVFVCIRCSGVHRSLGSHVTLVKSATMDNWNFKLVEKFKAHGGNKAVNAKYEALISVFQKLDESSHADSYKVVSFIRNKYIKKEWYKEGPRPKKLRKPRPKGAPKGADPKGAAKNTTPSPLRSGPAAVPPAASIVAESRADAIASASAPQPLPQSNSAVQKDDDFLFEHCFDGLSTLSPPDDAAVPKKEERRNSSISGYLNDLLTFDNDFVPPFSEKNSTRDSKTDILSKYKSPTTAPAATPPKSPPKQTLNAMYNAPPPPLVSPPMTAKKAANRTRSGTGGKAKDPMNQMALDQYCNAMQFGNHRVGNLSFNGAAPPMNPYANNLNGGGLYANSPALPWNSGFGVMYQYNPLQQQQPLPLQQQQQQQPPPMVHYYGGFMATNGDSQMAPNSNGDCIPSGDSCF